MGDEAKLIDPSGIPHFIGDLATLDTDVMLLTADAGQFRASGSDVHTEFQGLAAFYSAPEAEQLFATTLPVKQKSDAFADDLEKVATALSEYSFEVQPLVQKLDALKADATVFVNSVTGDDDWRKDQDKVDHNNDLWHDVNHTVAAFQAAERTAYNKIMALIGGAGLTADDGSHGKNTYGFNADDLDHAKETPWGAPVEREYEGWSWLVHQTGQVWDGVWHDGVIGTVHGLGTLFGSDGWGAAGEAWKNLAKLGTATSLTSATLGTWWLIPDDQLPSWLRDSRKVHTQAVKGFLAYDQWKTNPARAAGAFGFNVLTVAGTEGVGSAASGAGKAGAAARTLSVVGKVGRAIDPMTYIGKVGKFAFVKVGDTFSTLKNLHTGTYLDMANVGDRYTPAEHPVPLGERPVSVPDSAIEYVDAKGNPVYLTEDGHVLGADGRVRQHAEEAAHELTSSDRNELGSARESHSRELVGADARAEHGTGSSRPGGQEPGQEGKNGGSHAVSGEGGSGRPTEAGSAERLRNDGGARGNGSAGAGHGEGNQGSTTDRGSTEHADASDGHQADAAHGHAPGHDSPGAPSEGQAHGGASDGPPDIDPAKYTKNVDDLAQAHTGHMEPTQEAGVLDELSRAKMPEPDQQKVLRALRKDPYGAGVAEMISRGHLRDIEGYRKLLEMCKQGPTKADPKGMVPASYMAMRLATDLQEHGVGRVGVELDTQTFDLDVYTRHADGSVDYGYQLKDVTNIQGIKSAAVKAAKQLNHEGMSHRIAILDVHQSMRDLTPRMFNEAEFRAKSAGATFLLRFTDGSITVPPNGSTFP
ncbi:hypothetical protein ACWCRD_21265 [Streptomyces sp. NPDC002092]